MWLKRLYHEIFCIASSNMYSMCIPPHRSTRLQNRLRGLFISVPTCVHCFGHEVFNQVLSHLPTLPRCVNWSCLQRKESGKVNLVLVCGVHTPKSPTLPSSQTFPMQSLCILLTRGKSVERKDLSQKKMGFFQVSFSSTIWPYNFVNFWL